MPLRQFLEKGSISNMKIYLLGSVIQMKVTNLYGMNRWTVSNNWVLNTLLELLFLNVLTPKYSFRNQHIGHCLTLSWSSSLGELNFTTQHRSVFCILFVTFREVNRTSNAHRWQNPNWSKPKI